MSTTLVYAQVADSPSTNIARGVLDQFQNNMANWYAPLQQYAQHIFWMLVTIDIVWTLGRLALSKADMGDFLAELLKQAVTIGIFWAFLTHSAEWSRDIVESFRIMGNTASGQAGGIRDLQPSDVFNAGISICATILKTFAFSFDVSKFMESLALVFGGFIILISFGLIAALEIVALIESYVFIYAGVIFLGFSGHSFTSDLAKRYLFSILNVGTKLMVIQLLIGQGMKLIQSWADTIVLSSGPPDLVLMLAIVSGSVVFLALTKMVPDVVNGLFSGVSNATGYPLISSSMAAGSMASAVMMGTASGISAAFGNPALAQQFGRAAVDQGGEAYRHSTGHHGTNMLDRFPGYKGEDGKLPENTGFSGPNFKPENWYGGSSYNSIGGSSSSGPKSTASNDQN